MAHIAATASDYKDLLAQLVQIVTSDYVTAVAINSGGTGYVVGDILTVAGGTSTHAATLRVTSVAAGVVDGIQVEEHGAYTADPTLSANGVTGGTGSGASMDLTMQTAEWTAERDTTHSGSEKEVILRGDGSGSDNIYVGVRTYQDGGVTAYNWELAGFTGFDSGLNWEDQAGISPGRYDDPTSTLIEGGQFVLLDNASIDFWIFHTGRYITGVAKIGSTYESFFMGFLDTFATTSEAVYPLYIAGTCSQKDTRFNSTRGSHSSFIDPRGKSTGTTPSTSASSGVFKAVDGFWYSVANAYESSGAATSNLTESRTNTVTPTGRINFIESGSGTTANNIGLSGEYDWSLFKQADNDTPTYQIRATPGSVAKTPFFPCFLNLTTPSIQFPGEIPRTYWFSKAGTGIVAEDEFVIGTDRYLIFYAGNQSDDWNYYCIKKTF